MNLGTILAPNGLIDPAKLPDRWQSQALIVAGASGVYRPSEPQVTVREWSPTLQRHKVIYEGPLNWLHVRTLAAERAGLEDTPHAM